MHDGEQDLFFIYIRLLPEAIAVTLCIGVLIIVARVLCGG